MIDIKLAIMELARGVVIVCCALVAQLIKAVDTLQGQVFRGIPSYSELGTLLVELLSVQAVACCAN